MGSSIKAMRALAEHIAWANGERPETSHGLPPLPDDHGVWIYVGRRSDEAMADPKKDDSAMTLGDLRALVREWT